MHATISLTAMLYSSNHVSSRITPDMLRRGNSRNVDRAPNTLKVNGISHLLVKEKILRFMVSLLIGYKEVKSKEEETQNSLLIKLTICLILFSFSLFLASVEILVLLDRKYATFLNIVSCDFLVLVNGPLYI